MSVSNLNSTTGIVLADTTDESKTLVLPVASNIPGRVVMIKDAVGTFGVSSLTLSTSAGDTFQDGVTTSYPLTLPYTTQQFISGQNEGSWRWYTLNGVEQVAIQTQQLFVSSISSASLQAGNTLNITGVQQTSPGVAFLSTPNVQISATGSQTWQWGLNLPLSTIGGSSNITLHLTSNDAYTTFLVTAGCDTVTFNTTAISLTPYTYYIKNCQNISGSNVLVQYDTGSGASNVQGDGGATLWSPLSNGSGDQIANTATQILQWDGSVLTMY